MKEHEKKAYLIAQGCNAVDKYGVPEPETLTAMQEYSDQQNAELREAINLCRKSICEEQTINRGLREKISALQTENKDLFLKIKELEFTETVDNDCVESQSNEIDELKAWKESAMRELNELDLQSLGRKLGIGLGQSVSENLHAKVGGLLERVKGLEGALTATLNVARAYDRSRFVDILDKAEKTLKK